MEKIKKNWHIIVIILLLLFGMNRCANSCTNSNKYDKSELEKTQIVHQKDSIISCLEDSINELNTIIKIYEEKVSGLNHALTIQDEANKRISESKKNINVSIKQNK